MHKIAFSFMAIIVLASLVITILVSTPFSYGVWIDSLFLTSLFTTMIGTVLYIIEKGFFDSFMNNFKYFISKINKGRQMADEIEQKTSNTAQSLPKKYLITFPCLVAGSILLLVSIGFSIIQ